MRSDSNLRGETMHGLDTIIALNRRQQAAHDARNPTSTNPAHTFVDELRDTCDLYHGGRQLTPVEKQVQRYAEILLAMVPHEDLNKLAPVFPLERR